MADRAVVQMAEWADRPGEPLAARRRLTMNKQTRRLAVGRITDPVTGKAVRRDGRPWRSKTGEGPTSKYRDEPLPDEQVDDGMGAWEDRKEEPQEDRDEKEEGQ